MTLRYRCLLFSRFISRCLARTGSRLFALSYRAPVVIIYKMWPAEHKGYTHRKKDDDVNAHRNQTENFRRNIQEDHSCQRSGQSPAQVKR